MNDNYIDPADSVFVIGAAVFTTLISEGISWLLIYRTHDYKALVSNIENLQKKIDKQKEASIYGAGGASKTKAQEKKLAYNENVLKEYNQDLMKSRMSSTFFVMLFMIIFMSLLNSAYQGVVVAKLPFQPLSMIQNISHRNIPGNDITDCSMIFIYIMANLSLRPIIQKLLGVAGPRTAMPQSQWFGQ